MPVQNPQAVAAVAAEREVADAVPIAGVAFSLDDRVFTVSRLKFGPFLALTVLLIAQVRALGQLGLLRMDVLARLGQVEGLLDTLELFGQIAERAPAVAQELLGLLLGAQGPEDKLYIYEHLDFADFPDVVAAFMRYNPWKDVMEKLFRLGREIAAEYQTLRRNPSTSSDSPPTSPAPAMALGLRTP